MPMYSAGKKQTVHSIILIGIFIGLCFGTDLIVVLGGTKFLNFP
ncbi:MAG: hypothetical protein ACKVN8_00890 [Nitrosarchaeum sp.]